MGCFLRLLAMCSILLACAAPPKTANQPAVNEPVLDQSPAREPVRIHWTGVVAHRSQIRIDNPFGDVRLRFGGYQHQVEIQAVAQIPDLAAGFELVPKQTDQQLAITPVLPAGQLVAAGQRIDIVVYIPKDHPVRVSTARGLIEARGLQSDIYLRSETGNVQLRGVAGLIDAQTEQGSIEVAMDNPAVGGSQRLATSTGMIVASFSEQANAELKLATSGLIGTEFSVEVTQLRGREPNKQGVIRLGAASASIEITSKRGELRLYRRAEFVNAG